MEKERCHCNDGFFGVGIVGGCKSVADDCQALGSEFFLELITVHHLITCFFITCFFGYGSIFGIFCTQNGEKRKK